jgi:cytochrome c-type biogenesis protein CcmH
MTPLRARFLALLLPALLLVQLGAPARAADVPLEFNDPAMQDRYESLLEKLRCLVCQNENLAMSQADLAQDLREQIYHMMANGRSNQEIIDYLVARYGDFVLYDPPLQANTWLLWFGPFLFLLIGLVVMARFVRSRRTADAGEGGPRDSERLSRLLDEAQGED